ncbi:MAG: hypothetical protein QM817_17785 [Archangium sp.]
MRSTFAAAAVIAIALGSSPARAVNVTADVGGGVWLLEATQLDAHFRVDQELFDWFRVGVRPGVAVTLSEPNPRLAIPLDALVRFKLFVVYLDVFGGMYWIPSHVEPVRLHLGGGVGFKIWRFEFGFEVAYLQPSINLLGRVGFTIYQPGEKKPESEK